MDSTSDRSNLTVNPLLRTIGPVAEARNGTYSRPQCREYLVADGAFLSPQGSGMSSFSPRNLKDMWAFAAAWPAEQTVQAQLAQITW